MAITHLALLLALAQRPNDQYTLGYLDDTFVVRKGVVRETISRVVEKQKPKTILSFRRDKRFVVWDERGLTSRDGDWSDTSHLEAIPTSPKAQDKKAIRDTLEKIEDGTRSKAASGLSGAKRIGGTIYLLPRWEDSEGRPWLEVLVAVDVDKPHPKPRFVGKFEGISLGAGSIDDRLKIEKGQLTVAVNTEDAWGFASFEVKTGKFSFKPRGTKLVSIDDERRIIERTSYGTTQVGRDENGRTTPWLEGRGKAWFVEGDSPVLVRLGDRLKNAETGAEYRLPQGAAIRRAKAGVLIFWPDWQPRSARLLDPARFEEQARWELGTRR